MVEKYLRYEKTVQVELKFKSAAFPTVTVCNLNPYKNDLVNEIDSIRQTLDSYSNALQKADLKDKEQKAAELRTKRAAIAAIWAVDGDIGKHFTFGVGYTRCNCTVSIDETLDSSCTALKHEIPSFMDDKFSFNNFNQSKTRTARSYDWSDLHDIGEIPCMCQSVSHFCVALLSEPLNLWEEMQPTTTEVPEFEKAQGFQGMTDEVAITTRAKENLIFTTAALPPEEKQRLSYKKHEFIRLCSFNRRECDIENDFLVNLDPVYGNCYTFNSNATAHSRLSDRPGPAYGLRIMAYVNISSYLPTTEAAGVRIVVHDGQDVPYPDAFGFSAATGFLSSFGLHLTSIDRLSKPYGECDPEGVSTEGCHRRCFQRLLIQKCGCGDPRLPAIENEKYCSFDDSQGHNKLSAYCPTCNTPMKVGSTCHNCYTHTPTPSRRSLSYTLNESDVESATVKTPSNSVIDQQGERKLSNRGPPHKTQSLTQDTFGQYLSSCNSENCTGCMICNSRMSGTYNPE